MPQPANAEVRIDFAGVGAAKAGTSWLAASLAQHPQICMAEPKELNYFCERAIWPMFRVNASLGPAWLAQRFAHRKAGQLLGEFSPNYLCDPVSPRLLHAHDPECRLLFCFRHPVEAVASYYYQVQRETPINQSLDFFLQQYPTVEAMGLYYTHVSRFLEVFPRKQCLFLFFEDIQSNPAGVLRSCFDFLGVDRDFIAPQSTERVNEAQRPRSPMVVAALNKLRLLVQNHTGPAMQRLIWRTRLDRAHNWLVRRNLEPFTPPLISQTTRERMLEFYRCDTKSLAQLLGKDLSHWEH